ncbi:hypothetical protein GCM10017752_08560 [Streptomyces roseoviridis]
MACAGAEARFPACAPATDSGQGRSLRRDAAPARVRRLPLRFRTLAPDDFRPNLLGLSYEGRYQTGALYG